jgi:hypothetical protein
MTELPQSTPDDTTLLSYAGTALANANTYLSDCTEAARVAAVRATRHGMSAKDIAHLLGIDEVTVLRWWTEEQTGLRLRLDSDSHHP